MHWQRLELLGGGLALTIPISSTGSTKDNNHLASVDGGTTQRQTRGNQSTDGKIVQKLTYENLGQAINSSYKEKQTVRETLQNELPGKADLEKILLPKEVDKNNATGEMSTSLWKNCWPTQKGSSTDCGYLFLNDGKVEYKLIINLERGTTDTENTWRITIIRKNNEAISYGDILVENGRENGKVKAEVTFEDFTIDSLDQQNNNWNVITSPSFISKYQN